MRVLMLEAGPPRLPTRDFTEHVWPYQVKFRGFGNRQALLERQPIQRLGYACDQFSRQFFVDDHQNPYTFPLEKPFMWIRGRQVGGKTFCWARESYRYSDYEFKAASRDGYGEDWPFRYKDLEPYYEKVESFIGVSGSREGLAQMPDGKFLPPMNLSCGGMLARDVIGKKFGWVVMPDRVANLTVVHRGRPACHYCDDCQLGHYLMDHFTVEGAGGFLPQFKSSQRGPRGTPCGFLIPKYVNTDEHVNRSFLRGYRFDGDGSQELYAHAFGLVGFGSDWRRKVRTEIPYYFGITAQGECLPRYDNYVTLDEEKKDAWGIPVLRVVASYGENEYAMAKAMRDDIMQILDAMKVEARQPPGERLSVFGKNIHECGTARMGNDPKKSVVNSFCQLYDMKNVFVTDGAVFVTQGCYEPTLTIMAISARAGDYIADEYRQGNL